MTLSFFQVMHTHTLMYTTHTHALTSSHIHYTPAVAVSATSWALWCVHLLLENDCWRFSASLWQWLGDKISVGEREERVSQQWQKHFSFGQAKYRVRVTITTQGSRKIFAWKSWSQLQHVYWWHICDYLLFKYFLHQMWLCEFLTCSEQCTELHILGNQVAQYLPNFQKNPLV